MHNLINSSNNNKNKKHNTMVKTNNNNNKVSKQLFKILLKIKQNNKVLEQVIDYNKLLIKINWTWFIKNLKKLPQNQSSSEIKIWKCRLKFQKFLKKNSFQYKKI